MLNNNVVLISQSPSDIKYVLTLYNANKKNSQVRILVVGIENNYKFLLSLNLNATIEFLPVPNMRKVIAMLFYPITIRFVRRRLFSSVKGAKVYFFSRYIDYTTSFFIETLKKSCDVFYVKSVYSFIDDKAKKNSVKPKLKTYILKKLFLSLLFGLRVNFINHSGRSIYYYNNKSGIADISIEIDSSIFKKYKKRISVEGKDKTLLFFEGNGAANNYFINYSKDLRMILNTINNKYVIYVKPHPTHGYSSFLDEYSVTILESYVPAEFIDLDEVSIVLGIESAAIALVKHKTKISMLDKFDFINEQVKEDFRDQLSELSQDSVFYLQNLNQL